MSLLYSERVSAGKPPVAIRITRPYQNEEELLQHELDTISRTGVVLVGAQSRPEGVILRFELTLATGTPVLRGEGRVTGYKAAVIGSEPGLAVRFTRLDSKSKALVDKVATMREMRRSSLPPPPPSARDARDAAHAHPAPPAPPAPPAAPEPAPPSAPERPRDPPVARAPEPPDEIPVSVEVPASLSSSEVVPVSEPSQPSFTNREEVLARLRERAKHLSADNVGKILAAGAARRRA